MVSLSFSNLEKVITYKRLERVGEGLRGSERLREGINPELDKSLFRVETLGE